MRTERRWDSMVLANHKRHLSSIALLTPPAFFSSQVAAGPTLFVSSSATIGDVGAQASFRSLAQAMPWDLAYGSRCMDDVSGGRPLRRKVGLCG